MVRHLTHNRLWPSLLIMVLLAAALPATAGAAPSSDASLAEDEPAAQTSDSPCTGATTADYTTDPCGPSLTIPQWGDMGGWDDPTVAGTIKLVDLTGDGQDELVGLSPQGLMVNTWNSAWGQWAPANNQNQPFAFAAGSVRPDTIRLGQLADGVYGAIALAADGSGLETWYWQPGDGSPGSGSWSQAGENGPFADSDKSGTWTDSAYYSTIQFPTEPLEGASYSIIARGSAGIQLCTWDGSSSWSCKQATSGFSDSLVTDSGSLADFYYATIQFADVYTDSNGLELIGRDNTNGGGMQVYTWNSSTQTFNQLALSGQAPFGSNWNDPEYWSTIQPARFVNDDPAYEIAGRGPNAGPISNGVQWWGIWASGCGGQTAPCWRPYWGNGTEIPFTDAGGYTAPQYYATLQFADLDGDGYDEAMAREPNTGFTTWGLHPSWGWYNLAGSPTLTSGPSDDPLWSNPSYYETIQTGTVGAGQVILVARGKYGIRTWTWQGQAGWGRPLPYGFSNFATTAEDNAFALLNNYLDIESGNTIRDSYASPNSGVMSNYETCLTDSISGQNPMMPPTDTCSILGDVTPLANPNGVTAADWQNMVSTIQQEIAMVNAVNSHFNVVLAGIFTELFELDEDEFFNIVNVLFPDDPPSHSSNWEAIFLPLFEAVARSAASLAGPEVAIPVNLAIGGVSAALAAMQTPQTSTVDGELREIQAAMLNNATSLVTTNTAFFNYTIQDGGLLNLYGTLLDNQMWEIQGPQRAAAIANGQYQTALWLYQTILDERWYILLCVEGSDIPDENCVFLQDKHGNPDYTEGVNAIDGLYLSLGGSYSDPEIVDSHNQTLARITAALADTCSRAPTDGSAGWTYQGCNMGIPLTSIIPYDAIMHGTIPCPSPAGALQLHCNLNIPPPCVFNCPPGEGAGVRSSPMFRHQQG